MPSSKFNLDETATSWLKALRQRTGLPRPELCRLALCLSLEEPGEVDPTLYGDGGLEINRYTLTGEWDRLLRALVDQWMHETAADPNDPDLWLRTHVNRGLTILPRRMRSLADLDTVTA